MDALAGQRIVQVSCGSRDAQTLALVEGNLSIDFLREIIKQHFCAAFVNRFPLYARI